AAKRVRGLHILALQELTRTIRLRAGRRKMLDRWLGRDRIVAGAGFNRWLIPPAALAIHLCIGMAYGFSVFWLPLSRSLGVSEPITCAPDTSVWTYLFTTGCDWPQ